ncbi:hypothetical protein [Streptomyces alboniger]|uniref:Uncharacterized protein n=1 Tax=Streptomyces alboniger TaxID=132473 RepID=A0A5J6HM64_STRAD|nr:hypothetical protein [Streptomyces alboniger]QEV18115.1 hypothetical protein CP975_11915 [Streptomyces alboniger]
MAVAQLSPALRPSAHPLANPGYGKKSAPGQAPRSRRDFAHLPKREAAVAGYLDRLPEGSDISIKTLAKHLPYGQCALSTVLRVLSGEGHLRRVRRPITTDEGGPRWVWHTFFSRTARDDAWWTAFFAGDPAQDAVAAPAREASTGRAYDALARLGRTEPRLTLSATDCEALAPLAAEWFAREATEAQLARALAAGLPAEVAHPYGFVRARLLAKLPPPPPPAAPGYIVECTVCGEPGESTALPGGLCGGCRAGAGLPAERVRGHVERLRAALGGRSGG